MSVCRAKSLLGLTYLVRYNFIIRKQGRLESQSHNFAFASLSTRMLLLLLSWRLSRIVVVNASSDLSGLLSHYLLPSHLIMRDFLLHRLDLLDFSLDNHLLRLRLMD